MKRNPPQRNFAARRAHAIQRSDARGVGWARLARTIVLGTVAAVAGVIWLGEQYGVDRGVMLEFLATSALFVGGLIVAGLGGVALLVGLRKLRDR